MPSGFAIGPGLRPCTGRERKKAEEKKNETDLAEKEV